MNNLLVTGGCGFIGANFIRYVLDETDFDGRIVNVDKLTYAGNPENLAGVRDRHGPRYVFEKADIGDAAAVDAVFRRHRVDAVCHFAAESHVDRSIRGPGAFIRTNVLGTYTLLEAARARADTLERFHHVSTDEVYGSLGSGGYFTEETPFRPNSPYSASKAGSDHLVRAYGATYGLPTTVTHCSNNYGPYQFPEKLVPLILLNALEGRPLPVYGDGRHVRDWLYVDDHCRAVWAVMRGGRRGQTYNVGGDHPVENLAVVETLCDLLDRRRPDPSGRPRRELIRFVADRPGHDRRYAVDSGKIRAELGWRPRESFETGLEKTVSWYLDHRGWVERVKSGAYRDWVREHYGS